MTLYTMMNRLYSIFFFALFLVLPVSGYGQTGYPSSMFKELDHVLSMKDTYEDYFSNRVDQVKSLYKDHLKSDSDSLATQYEKNMILADLFRSHSLDSTMFYLSQNRDLAQKMGDKKKSIETDLFMAFMYSKSGFYLEASQLMVAYTPDKIPSELSFNYYQTIFTIAGELIRYSAEPPDLKRVKKKYREALLKELPEESFEWYNLKRDQFAGQNNNDEARKYALGMTSTSTPGTNRYAQAAYFVSLTYENGSIEQMEWLVESAVSDIMSSTKDYVSLNDISRLLFEAGEVDRAFRYVADYCLPDAMTYNGRLRPLQLSRFFPEIQKAYQEKSDHQQKVRTQYIIALCAMLVVLLLMIVLIFIRQRLLINVRNLLQDSHKEIENKNNHLIEVNESLKTANVNLQELNEKIVESDKVKEEYISLFLSILSENISTTRQYSNHVLKCIRHGRTKELESEINTMPPIEEDINKFYKMFDQTFINMYPDFIDKFNSLLIEGKEMHPKAGEILCPEQRIFALIKLGINDSSKIAALLHYSTNTIYNYKAKVKNRAKSDRNNFEQAIREL